MMVRLTLPFAIVVLVLSGCASMDARPPTRSLGWQVPLGTGTATSYADFDAKGAPVAVGIAFSATALDGLPSGSDGHHCVDRDKDGAIAHTTHCIETFEH